MSQNYLRYTSPLGQRYASKEMSELFGLQYRHVLWRRVWLALATAQSELGLFENPSLLEAMQNSLADIDFQRVRSLEQEMRHDVMAHLHAWNEQLEKKGYKSSPWLHLGATSAFVVDNADLMQMKQAFLLLRVKWIEVIKNLKDFVLRYKDMPALGYTHYQPAQPVTVGKRAGLYLEELLIDLEDIDAFLETLRFRGAKGTTGSQASYLTLFNGDEQKVQSLDERVAELCGFDKIFHVTGQTYTRKIDYKALALLSSMAQTAAKFAVDLRLLAGTSELEEPFEAKQVGSSAMAFKRNPMRSERIGALARFVMALPITGAYTASTQWLERSLDDSANKRISLSEAFLAVDSIAEIFSNITTGLVVNEKIIHRRLAEQMPFLVLETLLMKVASKKGRSRQELHEHARVLSLEAARQIKQEGKPNPLPQLLLEKSALFSLTRQEMAGLLSEMNNHKAFTGRCASLAENLVAQRVEPLLEKKREQPEFIPAKVNLRV